MYGLAPPGNESFCLREVDGNHLHDIFKQRARYPPITPDATEVHYMSYSLNSLKGVIWGII